MLAESHHSAQHSGARQALFSGLQHNCFINRMMTITIALTNEYSQTRSVFWNIHWFPHNALAPTYPAQTINKPSTFETAMLSVASPISPSRNNVKVCRP